MKTLEEDYKPTREELEAEGLLQMWCDCIESGHYGFAAWLPSDCIMRANADKRREISRRVDQGEMLDTPGLVWG